MHKPRIIKASSAYSPKETRAAKHFLIQLAAKNDPSDEIAQINKHLKDIFARFFDSDRQKQIPTRNFNIKLDIDHSQITLTATHQLDIAQKLLQAVSQGSTQRKPRPPKTLALTPTHSLILKEHQDYYDIEAQQPRSLTETKKEVEQFLRTLHAELLPHSLNLVS